ncbi:STM4504/CBY_0614 family protein [Tepidibacter sp. Z1-5]|uniref:STM4504/CBY_0614 family protein n=1 Tax=Tepidibacter sp. Z1-5 TaxID=3134138 RepID=UPI0030BED3FA
MIFEIFSKRRRKETGVIEDVYLYDSIPQKLRNQILHIWNYAIANDWEAWEFIHDTIARELGLITIVKDYYSNKKEGCIKFLLNHENTEETIDIIELSFVIIDVLKKNDPYAQRCNRKQKPEDAIDELNHRFKENNIGYEYINGKIIRIDRALTHSEVVKPAIKVLYEHEFEGANDEFMEAHKCYREGDYKGAIYNAQKSFESVMKTICERMRFEYNKEKDTASVLIKILVNEDFIPKSLSNHFDGLKVCLNGIKTSLESGLPTLRNRKAGHGQGEEIVGVPEYLAVYAINLVATNIVLLVDIYTLDYKNTL